MIEYSLVEFNQKFITRGLESVVGKEFSINKKSYSPEYVRLIIDYIINYLWIENTSVKNLETFSCGSWLLQFVFNEKYIELHELKNVIGGRNEYEFDLTLTIKFFKEQSDLCILNNVESNIPKISQKIAVSKEIYDGSEVNGVRYDSPDHMTGWYLTSNSYNGDIKSLSVDYLFYILTRRPDLAKFLALPVGYRFFKDNKEESVWKDNEIISSM